PFDLLECQDPPQTARGAEPSSLQNVDEIRLLDDGLQLQIAFELFFVWAEIHFDHQESSSHPCPARRGALAARIVLQANLHSAFSGSQPVGESAAVVSTSLLHLLVDEPQRRCVLHQCPDLATV